MIEWSEMSEWIEFIIKPGQIYKIVCEDYTVAEWSYDGETFILSAGEDSLAPMFRVKGKVLKFLANLGKDNG